MAKNGPSPLRPLTLRLLTAPGRAHTITRSLAQRPACKDLERNGQNRAITPEATYTPVSNRAGSRSLKKSAICGLFLTRLFDAFDSNLWFVGSSILNH
ncbi:ATP-dependent nuclease [Lacticaseibacillus rhamnosus]|nr:ATP-dependent nuclease [Lacticaseibacillus rhamnosus]MCT3179717.1 ATP-dependent nuclease [Lacticaseibacillus rhamnosus]MCT3182857.1 ATP-dependent nuclease [Lacticaseibacillus rhamnosus]MCT4447603.1 ATP-dependent nuclease [Lacticaseibacillus rhamnosus]